MYHIEYSSIPILVCWSIRFIYLVYFIQEYLRFNSPKEHLSCREFLGCSFPPTPYLVFLVWYLCFTNHFDIKLQVALHTGIYQLSSLSLLITTKLQYHNESAIDRCAYLSLSKFFSSRLFILSLLIYEEHFSCNEFSFPSSFLKRVSSSKYIFIQSVSSPVKTFSLRIFFLRDYFFPHYFFPLEEYFSGRNFPLSKCFLAKYFCLT